MSRVLEGVTTLNQERILPLDLSYFPLGTLFMVETESGSKWIFTLTNIGCDFVCAEVRTNSPRFPSENPVCAFIDRQLAIGAPIQIFRDENEGWTTSPVIGIWVEGHLQRWF